MNTITSDHWVEGDDMTAIKADKEQALDSFYALDNVVTIKITMPQADWDALRTEEPAGGRCNFNWKGGERYKWHEATSVEISGTSFPAATTFTQVGLKKKSFCGSISSEKPCVDIDFGKFSDANVPVVDGLIGSHYLALNNSIQDPSYIHQTLGYKLFAMAGLPHSRCNFAQVFVNGAPIGQGSAGVNSPGIFVNVEAIMKPYIKRNFNGNMNGNLYEIAHTDDFVSARLPFISVENLSKFDNKADLKLADDQIAAHGVAGASQMLDLDQFIKHYAMEILLKSWDGYANNTNNTYIYNDVNAVAAPGVNDVKFKMIPWGIDQILQPILPVNFGVAPSGLIASLVRNDAARRAQLIDQIRSYRDTVFSRETQQTVLKPMIDQMETLLAGFGVPNAVSEIAGVRQQLQLTGSGAGAVTAVARTPNHLDLFWVGLDGSVGSNWWDAGANNGRWNAAFEIAPAGSAAGAVTAVARTPNHLDVFWVGLDGSVGSNWWDAGANNGAWNTPFEIAPAKSAAGAVTAVARTPNHLDVFWVGLDGSVGSNWWDAGANNGAWNTPFEIAPAKSAAGAVTAVARTPNHLDVFWVGLDGSVGSNWWDAGANNGAWNTPFEIAPAKSAAGAVTAVARTPNHLDVFWVGLDGSVGSNWWDAGANNGAWNTPFEIAPAKSAAGRGHGRRPHPRSSGCVLGRAGRIGRQQLVGRRRQQRRLEHPVRDRPRRIGRRRGHGRRPHPRSSGCVLGRAGRIGRHQLVGRPRQQRRLEHPVREVRTLIAVGPMFR